MKINDMADGKWQMANGRRGIVLLRSAIYLLPFAMLLAVAGCRNPFDRTRNASGGPTGTIGNAGTFIIFGNELQSGGGAFEYPGSEAQSLTFNDTSNPYNSYRSIRYAWTGEAVAGQTIFAGFDLMYAISQALYNPSPSVKGLNLQATAGKPNYTKVTFYARGSLSSNTVLKIEAAADGVSTDPDPCLTLSTAGNASDDVCTIYGAHELLGIPPQALSTSWQKYTITIPITSLANVKDFFKATFVFTPAYGAPAGQGGAVYFDQIQYEQ